MAVNFIKDSFKYKQNPYMEKQTKQERKEIEKAFRRNIKQKLKKIGAN